MLSVRDFEEFKQRYVKQTQDINSGVWSVLLCSDAEQAAHFGETHRNNFDEVSGKLWHLGVFAELIDPHGRAKWRPDYRAYAEVNKLRASAQEGDYTLPKFGILFIDMRESQQRNSPVALDLNPTTIHDRAHFKRGFISTMTSINEALVKSGVGMYRGVPEEKSDEFFKNLHYSLKFNDLISRAARPLEITMGAVLGALFS